MGEGLGCANFISPLEGEAKETGRVSVHFPSQRLYIVFS